MKRNVELILVGVLLMLSINVQCQFAIAGVPGSIYIDIAPDTLLNAFHNGPEETFDIDIDQNGLADIRFRSYDIGGLGGSEKGVSVSALHSSIRLAFENRDSSWNNYSSYWMTIDVLKRFVLGDSIFQSGFIPASSAYLGALESMTGSSVSAYEWVNVGDKFIGFKLTNGSGEVAFGWIKVNCPSITKALIKEYSLGAFGLVSITEQKPMNEISIYPNPADDKIHFNKSDVIKNINEITLFDVYGKKHPTLLNNKNEMDVSALREGVYVLLIKTNEGVVTKKIVVQR